MAEEQTPRGRGTPVKAADGEGTPEPKERGETTVVRLEPKSNSVGLTTTSVDVTMTYRRDGQEHEVTVRYKPDKDKDGKPVLKPVAYQNAAGAWKALKGAPALAAVGGAMSIRFDAKALKMAEGKASLADTVKSVEEAKEGRPVGRLGNPGGERPIDSLNPDAAAAAAMSQFAKVVSAVADPGNTAPHEVPGQPVGTARRPKPGVGV